MMNSLHWLTLIRLPRLIRSSIVTLGEDLLDVTAKDDRYWGQTPAPPSSYFMTLSPTIKINDCWNRVILSIYLWMDVVGSKYHDFGPFERSVKGVRLSGFFLNGETYKFTSPP